MTQEAPEKQDTGFINIFKLAYYNKATFFLRHFQYMDKSRQYLPSSIRTATQYMWIFLSSVVLTFPGVLIIFLLILTGFRLTPELISPSFLFFDLVAIILLIIGVRSMVSTAHSFMQAQRWETEGQITNGAVEEIWFEATHAKYQHYILYFVRYRFQVKEKTYILQQGVSQKEYASLFKGKVVPVKYLPKEPRIARMVYRDL